MQDNQKRRIQIVFIGKNLNRDELTHGVTGCLVRTTNRRIAY